MITPDFYMDEGVYYKSEIFWGLSTDSNSMPTNVANGSVFIEMDTSKVYFFDAENGDWLEWGAETDATNAEGGE